MFQRRHSFSTNTKKLNKDINPYEVLSKNNEEGTNSNVTDDLMSHNIVQENKDSHNSK